MRVHIWHPLSGYESCDGEESVAAGTDLQMRAICAIATLTFALLGLVLHMGRWI